LKTTWKIPGRKTTRELKGISPLNFAETVPGESTTSFSKLADELDIYLTIPFLETDPNSGVYYNSVVLASPEGECLLHYRKLNPWPFAERGWATKGNFGNVYVDTPYGRMGLLICYDINYEPPNLKKLGIDHLLYPIAWVDDKDSDWYPVKLPNIAKKNNINIIGANWTIPSNFEPDWHGYGKTEIISREGKILAKTDRDIGETIVYAELPIVKK
jgi:nitrilase